MDQDFEEIFSLLDTIERIEIYTKQNADPDTFFAANYQKTFNDKINLLISISREIERKDDDLKEDLEKNSRK